MHQVKGTLQLLQSPSANVHRSLRFLFRNESSFVPRKILVVAKLSRYHFERLREPKLSEAQLKVKLLERGSDYDTMLASHMATKAVENQVVQILQKMNVEYKIIDRTNLDHSLFTWADLVLPVGGDGTFLLASNLIFNDKKPVMGINSYPQKSEGYLLLPAKYTNAIPEIFEKLRAGHYSILMRRRIRITLKGEEIWQAPFHMHEKGRIVGSDRFYMNERFVNQHSVPTELPTERRLPWLALNEVFMGETLSARTSSLLIKFDEERKYHKVKGSGLCVSTGTGSTSWYKSIHSLNHQTVREILSFVDKRKFTNDEIDAICSTFNNSLRFDAEDSKLCYSIRDMIMTNAVPVPKDVYTRGFCRKVTVKSQCFDAGLVLDGGIAVPFNFGTIAEIETFREDSLRTVSLLD
ncbi:PREDICTED: NAD kinase 2, mitochondrial isoform X2 [Wasmannia auropunctata]|uniref:NAD kinase 2, mitochondrial isoform X2 n=1 Tax=Wasmannia auropunctata TaxID=64793 RepID=UPI0005EF7ABB|nr:PREDICTED: NAD kinase 2, mitochondrial isoform X2 [Wasmannia auropunctata]